MKSQMELLGPDFGEIFFHAVEFSLDEHGFNCRFKFGFGETLHGGREGIVELDGSVVISVL